jgi:hypothetical protein
LAGDALELPKEVELGIFARVAPLGQHKMSHEFIQHLRGPNVSGVNQIEVRHFANDS